MSQRMMCVGQVVGYDFEEKRLIITVDDKMAQKLKADGWAVAHEDEMGYFVSVKMAE